MYVWMDVYARRDRWMACPFRSPASSPLLTYPICRTGDAFDSTFVCLLRPTNKQDRGAPKGTRIVYPYGAMYHGMYSPARTQLGVTRLVLGQWRMAGGGASPGRPSSFLVGWCFSAERHRGTRTCATYSAILLPHVRWSLADGG